MRLLIIFFINFGSKYNFWIISIIIIKNLYYPFIEVMLYFIIQKLCHISNSRSYITHLQKLCYIILSLQKLCHISDYIHLFIKFQKLYH